MKGIISDLSDVDILKSWYWDIEQLNDQVNELRKTIRKAEKERKLQPPLLLEGINGPVVATQYQILRIDDEGRCQIFCERRKPYVEGDE